MNPKIIGLTLNYRDASRSIRCIYSLLADGADAVLVWDNSEDGGVTAQALRVQLNDEPRVTVEISVRNLGFAAGVNRGIEAILERWPQAWIMLINNDAVLHCGAIEVLTVALRAQHQAVIAYPQVDHGGKVTGTVYYQRLFALLSFNHPWLGSFSSPPGSVLLIAPERIGLPIFDEDFFMYGEDVMLGWQLGSARMCQVPQVLAWHEGSASSRNGSEFYETYTVAGHWLLANKLARGRIDRFFMLTCRSFTLGIRSIVRAVRFRSVMPIRALLEGWRVASRNKKL